MHEVLELDERIDEGRIVGSTHRKYSLDAIQSKREARDYIRKVLSRYGLYEPFDDQTFDFILRDVLSYHPRKEQKMGTGVSSLYLERNKWGTNQIVVVRTDGSSEHVSWLKCVDNRYATGLARPERLGSIDDALREAVSADIWIFRDSQPTRNGRYWCVDTRSWEAKTHVDHKDPSFCEIVEMFLSERKLNLEDIEVVPLEGGGHKMKSQVLADEWRKFHNAHAILQILSAHGNLSKSGPRREDIRSRNTASKRMRRP